MSAPKRAAQEKALRLAVEHGSVVIAKGFGRDTHTPNAVSRAAWKALVGDGLLTPNGDRYRFAGNIERAATSGRIGLLTTEGHAAASAPAPVVAPEAKVDHLETREVLADAYTGKNRSLKACALLTHSVEIAADDREIRVLCTRVALDSICDGGGANPGDLDAKPTCPRCAKKDPRFA